MAELVCTGDKSSYIILLIGILERLLQLSSLAASPAEVDEVVTMALDHKGLPCVGELGLVQQAEDDLGLLPAGLGSASFNVAGDVLASRIPVKESGAAVAAAPRVPFPQANLSFLSVTSTRAGLAAVGS